MFFERSSHPSSPKKDAEKSLFSCPWRKPLCHGNPDRLAAAGVTTNMWGLLFPKSLPSGERLTGLRALVRSRGDQFPATTGRRGPRRRPSGSSQSPKGFLFDIKLHRAFLAQSGQSCRRGQPARLSAGRSRARCARRGKMGTFLLVLDPSFSPEKHRIQELDLLAEKLKPDTLAVELRPHRLGQCQESHRHARFISEKRGTELGGRRYAAAQGYLAYAGDGRSGPIRSWPICACMDAIRVTSRAKSAAEASYLRVPRRRSLKELAARIGIMAEKSAGSPGRGQQPCGGFCAQDGPGPDAPASARPWPEPLAAS